MQLTIILKTVPTTNSKVFLRGLLNMREKQMLKGLGHAILGNFSTDRMVIELTKILK